MTMQPYKDGLVGIAVNPELIDRTRKRMRERRDGAPKHVKVMRYASMAACLTVITLAAITFPKLIKQTAPSGSPFNTAALHSASSERQSAAAGSSFPAGTTHTPLKPAPSSALSPASASSANSAIFVNQLGDMRKQQPIAHGVPCIGRVEKWTFQQYCDLLGFDPLPTSIPKGLSLIPCGTKNISFQINGKRLDVCNTWGFVYAGSPADNGKSVTVQVNPSSIPYWSVPRAYQLKGGVQIADVNDLLNLGRKSEINGTEVTIWHKDEGSVWDYMETGAVGKMLEIKDYYCADFKYRGAGFSITAQDGISGEEFVQVLKSIIR